MKTFLTKPGFGLSLLAGFLFFIVTCLPFFLMIYTSPGISFLRLVSPVTGLIIFFFFIAGFPFARLLVVVILSIVAAALVFMTIYSYFVHIMIGGYSLSFFLTIFTVLAITDLLLIIYSKKITSYFISI